MHIVARILLVVGLLALTTFFLATLQYGGTSWSEGLLAIVPLTLFVLLGLRWAKHPPSRLVKDSPEWFSFRKRAGVGLGIFGIVYFLALGAGTALYSSSQEGSYRSLALEAKREAREAELDEMAAAPAYDPYGYESTTPRPTPGVSSRELASRASDYDRKASDCARGVEIGTAYCGVAVFPLLGLLLALLRKPRQSTRVTPPPGYGPAAWPQQT